MARARWLLLLAGPVLAPASLPAQDRLDWGEVQFDRERGITVAMVAGRSDSVWTVLRPLIAELGIKPSVDDRAAGRIGNPRFRAIRRLGKEPLSRFLSCGSGMTGPNVDSYHVYIGLLVSTAPMASGRTRVELHLTADAVDVPGGRSERVPCTTTGRLEFRIVERLESAFPGTR